MSVVPVPGPLPPVELSGHGLVLRRPRREDVPDVLAASQDEVTQHWTTIPVPYREEHAVSFVEEYAARGWEDGTMACFAIVRDDDRWAGALDLRLGVPGTSGTVAEVGYAVAPWARGQGVASAALRLACSWGFAGLGLARVDWWAHVGNWASRRTAERVGFQVEGTCRSRLVVRGERRDAWVGGLLPGDLR